MSPLSSTLRKSLSPNSRKNWYKTNKRNYIPNRKRTFDNAGMYKEGENKTSHGWLRYRSIGSVTRPRLVKPAALMFAITRATSP